MKKTILIILAIVLLLLPYTANGSVRDKYKEIEPGITTYIDVKNLYIDQMALDSQSSYCIAKDGDNTVVIFWKGTSSDNYVKNVLVYSPERKCIYKASCDINSRIEPVEIGEDLKNFLSCDVRDVMKKYGEFHTILGSGNWWNCYITEDGYCIGFNLESDDNKTIIGYAFKSDFLNNDKVIEKAGY